MSEPIDPSRVLETLVQNAQTGQRYRVKLVDDPVVYEGIPLSKPGDTSHDPDAFMMEVTAPSECAGTIHRRVGDIEWLERV